MVATAGGREVVVDGVEVRETVLRMREAVSCCKSCPTGCCVRNGLQLRFSLSQAKR